jgi:hypothetical protein
MVLAPSHFMAAHYVHEIFMKGTLILNGLKVALIERKARFLDSLPCHRGWRDHCTLSFLIPNNVCTCVHSHFAIDFRTESRRILVLRKLYIKRLSLYQSFGVPIYSRLSRCLHKT